MAWLELELAELGMELGTTELEIESEMEPGRTEPRRIKAFEAFHFHVLILLLELSKACSPPENYWPEIPHQISVG